jgi:hypothetical protein
LWRTTWREHFPHILLCNNPPQNLSCLAQWWFILFLHLQSELFSVVSAGDAGSTPQAGVVWRPSGTTVGLLAATCTHTHTLHVTVWIPYSLWLGTKGECPKRVSGRNCITVYNLALQVSRQHFLHILKTSQNQGAGIRTLCDRNVQELTGKFKTDHRTFL